VGARVAVKEDIPIGSLWRALHSQGEDIVLVLDEPKHDGARAFIPCLVMTTGQRIEILVETWIANFSLWDRLQ